MTPSDEKLRTDAERQRAEHYDIKDVWKSVPGNRYTAEELREMSASLGPIRIVEAEMQVMRLD